MSGDGIRSSRLPARQDGPWADRCRSWGKQRRAPAGSTRAKQAERTAQREPHGRRKGGSADFRPATKSPEEPHGPCSTPVADRRPARDPGIPRSNPRCDPRDAGGRSGRAWLPREAEPRSTAAAAMKQPPSPMDRFPPHRTMSRPDCRYPRQTGNCNRGRKLPSASLCVPALPHHRT
jgi:hypothetical protein